MVVFDEVLDSVAQEGMEPVELLVDGVFETFVVFFHVDKVDGECVPLRLS